MFFNRKIYSILLQIYSFAFGFIEFSSFELCIFHSDGLG